MERVDCPHCGFVNFSVSSYCGGCKRPLPRRGGLKIPSIVPRSSQPAKPTPPPEASAQVQSPRIAPARAASASPSDATDSALVKARIARRYEVCLAFLIDLALLKLVGLAWVVFEWLARGREISFSFGSLDTVATWLAENFSILQHAVLVMTVVALVASVTIAKHGQTLGRRLLGMHLVESTGRSVGMTRLLLRSSLALISAACFGAGFLWMIVDKRARTWHDVLTNTVVVANVR